MCQISAPWADNPIYFLGVACPLWDAIMSQISASWAANPINFLRVACGDSSYLVFNITECDCKTSVCCITGTKVKSRETREYNIIDSDVITIFKYFEKHT